MTRTRCCRPLLSLLLLFLLSACIARKTGNEGVVAVNDRPAPMWIRITPEDPGYYHGIGFVPETQDITADCNAAALKAREAMIDDITSNLKRGLGSKLPDQQLFSRLAWDGVLADLQQTAPQEIYVEAHKHRVWAYVRVGQAELGQLLDRRKAQLEPKARRSIQQADGLWQSGNLVEALKEQLAALHRLAGPEGLTIKGNSDPLLRNDVELGLVRMLGKVQFTAISGPDGGPPSVLRETPLVVEVRRADDNQPLARFPVAFRFTRGEGSITPTALTDAQGRVSAQLQAVDPRISPAQVLASPDLQALLTSSHLTPLPDSVFEPMPLPSARFTLELSPPRMILTHFERGGTGGNRSTLAINELAEAFRAQGMQVREADVELLVNPEVFQKVEAGRDPGNVSDTDFVGVVSISLDQVKQSKGKYQTVLTGAGTALFRLYDMSDHTLVMDIRMQQSVTGFSQGDMERNFFLQSMDELRSRVLDQLAEDPFHQQSSP